VTVDRTREALRRMAEQDPPLAARLIVQGLPAAAARIPGRLAYDLVVEDVGSYRISVSDGDAEVTRISDGALPPGPVDDVDFRLRADARTLADLAAGESPAWLMLSGRLRINGKRRRALKLRAMGDDELSIADAVKQGGWVDVDAIYRSLEYLIDPDWTAGHRFAIGYRVGDEGSWYVQVNDGEPVRVTSERPERVDATVSVGSRTYRQVLAGELTPTQMMQNQLANVTGALYPVTLFGRWIDRAQ
jgi:putative sterol carrier protein